MHCPKCGDPFASDEARFCRRCGLEIEGVKEFLAVDATQKKQLIEGVKEFLAAGAQEKKLTSEGANRKYFRWAMAASMAALIAMFINIFLRALFPVSPIFGKFTVFVLLGCALLIFTAFAARQERLKCVKRPLQKAKTTKELQPPQEYIFGQKALNYKETSPPASVTEHTTKFFEDE
jgi:hypothetical protein